jgi:hypothetical protein
MFVGSISQVKGTWCFLPFPKGVVVNKFWNCISLFGECLTSEILKEKMIICEVGRQH